MKPISRQQGVSLSGLIFWCVLIGVVLLIAMKLFPLYNEKFKIDAALTNTASQAGIGSKSSRDVMTVVLRNFEISDVDRFEDYVGLAKVMTINNIKDSRDKQARIAYEIRGPLIGPLDIVLKYDKTVVLKAGIAD